VAEWLGGHYGIQRRVDRIPATNTHRIAQFDALVAAETTKNGASSRYADAVAAGAEIVGEGRNEAYPPTGFGNVIIARRSAGSVERRNQDIFALL